jgi:STE24 endopeptidase
MFGLLPLIFALLVAETTAKTHALVPLPGSGRLLATIAGCIAGWALVNEVAARLIARTRQRRLLGRWELAAQAAMLLWFAWACYGWGWSSWANGHDFGYTLAIAPWVAMQAAHWWGLAPAVRAISGHPWSRAGLVAHQFRFGVLPMAIVLPLFDVGAWIAVHWHLEPWFDGYWGLLLGAYCAQLFMVVLLILLPLALMPLWGAKRMLSSELEQLMREACVHMGVKVAGLMRWPVPGGRVYNAAVVGMMPQLRYVLFTDDLMRDLPSRQVLAVLGHELGHARHGHLWLYFLFANATIMVSFLVDQWLPGLLRPLVGPPPAHGMAMGDDDPLAPLVKLLVGFGVMAVLFRLVFGYLSRACERQADLAGAELVGDPLVMGDALKSVAHLSGQPENEPSWRHYSIAERVAFLERVRQRPQLAGWHHHLVQSMRHGLIALIIALFVAAWLFDPRRDAATLQDPGGALAQWIDQDHDLDRALHQADQGDILALKKWVNRAGEDERSLLAKLLLRMMNPGPAANDAKQPAPVFDDRVGYRYVNRLRAFTDVPTGDAELDLALDNALAYILVAGTMNPSAQDLKLAQLLLPRLETAMREKSDYGVLDTIGCVHAALGDHLKAKEAFAQASKLLAEDRSPRTEAERQHLASLARRRLDAATRNAARSGLPDFVPEPFPRDWPGAASEPVAVPPAPPAPERTLPEKTPSDGAQFEKALSEKTLSEQDRPAAAPVAAP